MQGAMQTEGSGTNWSLALQLPLLKRLLQAGMSLRPTIGGCCRCCSLSLYSDTLLFWFCCCLRSGIPHSNERSPQTMYNQMLSLTSMDLRKEIGDLTYWIGLPCWPSTSSLSQYPRLLRRNEFLLKHSHSDPKESEVNRLFIS